MIDSFGDTLAARVAERQSQIVLGLDPDPGALWPGIAEATVVCHCRALIDAVAPACVAVKPQLACFERLGAPGWSALQAVVEHAHARGLLVIADGKRGDIAITAQAYGQALFSVCSQAQRGAGSQAQLGLSEREADALCGLGADMATVNPLLGRDAVLPLLEVARATGAGVLVLVRTSNPGAADIQDLELAGGGRVWERLAGLVEELGSAGVGEAGLSDVGAVVGATAPEHLARARELMPHAVFLLPGIGAQGGRVQELVPAFAVGRAGGLVSASRSIANAYLTNAHRDIGGDPASAARAEAERLRAAAWALSE